MKALITVVTSLLLTILPTTNLFASEYCNISLLNIKNSKTSLLLDEVRTGTCMFLPNIDNRCFMMVKSNKNKDYAVIYDFDLRIYNLMSLPAGEVFYDAFEPSGWISTSLNLLGFSEINDESYYSDDSITCEDIDVFLKTSSEKSDGFLKRN